MTAASKYMKASPIELFCDKTPIRHDCELSYKDCPEVEVESEPMLFGDVNMDFYFSGELPDWIRRKIKQRAISMARAKKLLRLARRRLKIKHHINRQIILKNRL